MAWALVMGSSWAGGPRARTPWGRWRCPIVGRWSAHRPACAASGVGPVGVLQPEEVAVAAVGAVLLVDEVELALVERPEPLVPVDLLEVGAAVAGEVEAQDTDVAVVAAAGHGGGRGVPRLGPLADGVVV